MSSLACRLEEDEGRLVDIEEVTAFFSEEKYSGEILTWSTSHGVYEAIVRPSHQQVSQSQNKF